MERKVRRNRKRWSYGTALGAERFGDTNKFHVLAGFFPYPNLVKQGAPNLDVEEVASKFPLDTDERTVIYGTIKGLYM
jgi:hypothetical protein